MKHSDGLFVGGLGKGASTTLNTRSSFAGVSARVVPAVPKQTREIFWLARSLCGAGVCEHLSFCMARSSESPAPDYRSIGRANRPMTACMSDQTLLRVSTV